MKANRRCLCAAPLRRGSFVTLSLFMLICISMLVAQPTITIPAKTTTSATGNDVDDCAIWVHPIDPAKSLVIVNDKGPMTGTGGLYVYKLNGEQLQKVSIHQPQNPDIRYNVVFGPDTMDVLVCIDRERGNKNYNKVRVFKINPAKAEASSGFLTEITASAGIAAGQNETYGHCLYQRPSDGALFSVVSPYGNTDFTQIKLESDGAGKVKGTIVRTWGGDDIEGDLCEGISCDDEFGFIYICDEDAKVMKYHADPDKNINTLAGAFAQKNGIVSDREGIDIYECGDGTGFILVSSQGNDQIKVYDRVTNAFMGTVVPEGMKDCDGLDVTAAPLGGQFPHGMAAIHLGSMAGSQFSFYDWSNIATGLSLATPCDAQRFHDHLGISIRGPKSTSSPDVQCSINLQYIRNRSVIRVLSPIKGIVQITLYGLNGQLIGTLYNGALRNNGIDIPFNAGAQRPGAYFVKCSSNTMTFVKELLIAR